MDTAVSLLLPPVLTMALAFALHVLAKERAQRVALLPVAATVLTCWVFIVRPGWVPVDDVRRVLHIAVGAALLGLALDAIRPPRFVAAVLVAGFVLGSALASVTSQVVPQAQITLGQGLLSGALAVAAFLTLARFDTMRSRAVSLVVLLTVVALGLAVLASIAGSDTLRGYALVLATALAGYFLFVVITGTPASDGLVLIVAAPMLAIIWALAQGYPELRLALACLPLVLFAEATALRVPLPAARISEVLYPLVLAGLASLPLILAGLIAFVTSGA